MCASIEDQTIAAHLVENRRLNTGVARLQELLRGVGANRYWEGRWRDADAENKRLRAALELPLLFYAVDWSEPVMAKWLEITGTTQATTKVMCDHIRKALAEGCEK